MTKDCLNDSYHLNNLNRQQRRAATHGLKNGPAGDIKPLLVIAGAGSGKTKTLSHRAAHLVVKGMDPRRILLLTFSRHAAEEMAYQVKKSDRGSVGWRSHRAAVVRHLPCYWGPADPGICKPDWSEAVIHDPRSARRCRFDEFGSRTLGYRHWNPHSRRRTLA
jgi:hypothetical protein